MELTYPDKERRTGSALVLAFLLYIFCLIVVNTVFQLETVGFVLEFALIAPTMFLGVVGLGHRLYVPRIVFILTTNFLFVSTVGALANPHVEAVTYLMQVTFSFVLIVALYSFFSVGQLSHLYDSFWHVSLIVAIIAILSAYYRPSVAFLNPESFYSAGRLQVVGGNANFTGIFFVSAAVHFLMKFVQSRRLGNLVFVGISLMPVFLSGSFGALISLSIVSLGLILLKFRIWQMLFLTIALIFTVLMVDFIEVGSILLESELRALRRMGALVQFIHVGEGSLTELGSASVRQMLLQETLNEISRSVYLFSGMGVDYWKQLSLPNKVHLSFVHIWISLGFLSALAYISIFVLALTLSWRTRRFEEAAIVMLVLLFSCLTPSLYRRELLFPICLIITRLVKLNAK